MRHLHFVFFTAAAALIAACSQSNPLIGEWKMEGPMAALASTLGESDTLVFAEDSMTMGSDTTKVTYDVRDSSTVVVNPEGEEPVTVTIKETNGKECIDFGPSDIGLVKFCRKT
jgi:hypothetical protein